MPITPESFAQRLAQLRADLTAQGRRVERVVEAAIEAIFTRSAEQAQWVVQHDAVIDRADVELERAAVDLLTEAARETVNLEPEQIRMVFTCVKVNNELERIADGAVEIAEQLGAFDHAREALPETFHVMGNSVAGVLHDANAAFEKGDAALAYAVLASDDTIDQFEAQLLREAQRRLVGGEIDAERAFALHTMAIQLERMGDHCTNIAEQVIYVSTGAIVRHTGGRWSEPIQPD